MKKIFILALAIMFVGMAGSATADTMVISGLTGTYVDYDEYILVVSNAVQAGDWVLDGTTRIWAYDDLQGNFSGGGHKNGYYFEVSIASPTAVSLAGLGELGGEGSVSFTGATYGDIYVYDNDIDYNFVAYYTLLNIVDPFNFETYGFDGGQSLVSQTGPTTFTFDVRVDEGPDIRGGAVPELPANMLVILGVALMGGLLIVRRVNIKA